jgi:hypothetical protein
MKAIILLALLTYSYSFRAQAPTTGLVSYYKLDGNYINEINTALNGTNFSSTSTTNNSMFTGTAMNFNNPSSSVPQYATHPINSTVNFSGTNDFSVSMFVYINSPYVHGGGLYDNMLNYNGYGIWHWNSPGYIQINFSYKGSARGTTSGTVPLGSWFHLCCVRNSGTLSIYINGVLISSGAEGSGAPVYSFAPRIGSMFFNGTSPPQYNGHHGKLDELRIYNRALSAAEISQIQTLLPIKLSSFSTLHHENNGVLLSWKTEQEYNTKHFEIERSTNGQDFEYINKVIAIGNSSIIQNYSYIDYLSPNILTSEKVFYRLKIIDNDSSFKYSKVNVVQVKNKNTTITVKPNPVANEGKIEISGLHNGKLNISILNSLGVSVLKFEKLINQSNFTFPIQTSTFENGVYYISINNNGIISNKKFVVNK